MKGLWKETKDAWVMTFRKAKGGNIYAMLVLALSIFFIAGWAMCIAMFSVSLSGCNSNGSRMGMGGVRFSGPTKVCLHKIDTEGKKPYWGEIAPQHMEIGADPLCLLNLEIPRNWDCYLPGSGLFGKGSDFQAHHYRMQDQFGNLIMELPQPVCHQLVGDGSKPMPEMAMPLDVKIPTQAGGPRMPMPSDVASPSPANKADNHSTPSHEKHGKDHQRHGKTVGFTSSGIGH